jgi:hypothetical protein
VNGNPNHLMVDIETLGTAPGSIILSIGAVVFDPLEGKLGEGFYLNLQVAPQEAAGLTTSPATVAWWSDQSPLAKLHLANPEPLPVTEVLETLASFYLKHGCERVWGHGATFDVVLLDRLFAAFAKVVPWKFWQARDTRTLFELTGTEVKRSEGTHHYALDDAKRQAEAVCEAYHALGMTRHPWVRHLMMALAKRRTGEFYKWRRA